MPRTPVNQHPFVKGIIASNQPLAQVKGAIQRGSNLVYTSRGALDVADGSQILHAFNGQIQAPNVVNKIMATFLFSPIGAARYYLALAKMSFAQGLQLGAVQNLVASLVAGGSLSSGTTYVYKVTALDGAGGETSTVVEVNATPAGGNLSVQLTWNVVPNATGYNVYRGQSGSGSESLLRGPGLPVPQVTPGTLSVTYTDTGAAVTSSVPISTATHNASGNIGTITTTSPHGLAPLALIVISGVSFAGYNGTWVVSSVLSPTQFTIQAPLNQFPFTQNGSGGTVAGTPPPISDLTQQTVLFQMPPIIGQNASLPVSYNKSNIVAVFPADLDVDGGGGGGSGGGGGTGGGGTGGGGGGSLPTPSGGIPGNVSPIPQFRQFTNRAVIAMGNGFPPQLFSDATGTPVNPATVAAISAITADAFGVVTVTTAVPHGLTSAHVGGNVVIAGVTNPVYNTNGFGVSAFVVISVVDATHYKIRNLNAQGAGASSGGTSTTTSLPIISTFTPAFPKWSASTPFLAGDIIVPITQPSPAIYLTCSQPGNSGAAEPTWPGGAPIGSQITEVGAPAGTPGVVWTVTALLNSAAPPPPGAAHIEIFGGALWVEDTSPSNTSTGLDGPTSLRMSTVGNPNAWNPVNQAFLDKDDGTEGMGLAKFTITALGIPPQGSLIAFKNYVPYQIIGIFGASDFAIQPVASNMGCISPRTIDFVPGFGIMRMSHLGVAVFNGVKDELISEQIRPYLFPMNDSTFQDITVVDASNVALCWAAQTANPPMYVMAAPIGVPDPGNPGELTRLFCYDLVFKAWGIADLPFPIASMSQFRTVSANPVTVLGGFFDGCLSRWQAGDIQWDTGGSGARVPSNVAWSFRTNRVASQEVNQRIFCRRLVVNGNNSGAAGTLTVAVYKKGVLQQTMTFRIPANRIFDVDCPVGFSDKDFDAVISSSIHGDVHGVTYEIEPRPAGVVVGTGV
jgi:hypothetical protein